MACRGTGVTWTPRCEEMAFECDHMPVPNDREEVRLRRFDGPGKHWLARVVAAGVKPDEYFVVQSALFLPLTTYIY